MVSEKFLDRQINQLKSLDITSNMAIHELSNFYGMITYMHEDLYENKIALSGKYKEFDDLYKKKHKEHHDLVMARLENDAIAIDKFLKHKKEVQ